MVVLNENNILLDRDAETNEEVIRLAVGCLQKNGYVGDNYVDAVLQREQEFPTGLPTEDVLTALPHAFCGDVYKTGVCVVRLNQPVEFRNMGDPDETLSVEMAFVLCNASSGDDHLDDLQELMDCFCRVGLLADLKKAATPADFIRIFNSREQYPEEE